MPSKSKSRWKERIVTPEEVIACIKPGMNIFLDTGVAEPRTLLNKLMALDVNNARDLELIQIAGYGDTLSLNKLRSNKYRLKSFFSGWVSSQSMLAGRIDLIPGRFSQISRVFQNQHIPIDAAFLQITPPNAAGYCSLGVAVDVAREVMEQASLVVGEINDDIPFTYGDTVVKVSDFNLLVRSTEPPFYFDRWPVDNVFKQIAKNIARVIDDGDCLNFSIGSLFEALSRQLTRKRHLGIHSPYITDALMDLIRSGAVSNYRKKAFRGKTLVSYALGTRRLMRWLHKNPLVDFQRIDQVCNPVVIGQNPHVSSIFHIRKVDLLGGIAFHPSRGVVAAGPGEAEDFVNGAEISRGGRTIFGLPSRNQQGQSNIMVVLRDFPNQFRLRDSVNMVVTEYGIAALKWRSIRERAQAMIDIAHPEDRERLMQEAKKMKLIYTDQIFLAETAHFYPSHIAVERKFKQHKVRIRPIRPSDEEAMRRFFYRFSDQTVYYRFFYRFSTMPHDKMQAYVNVDYTREMALVALVGDSENEEIIAEARYSADDEHRIGDVAFMVDEGYQGLGLASYLYDMLIRLARERCLKGFSAEVIATNKAMMRVFEKGDLPLKAQLKDGVYRLKIPFGTGSGSKSKS